MHNFLTTPARQKKNLVEGYRLMRSESEQMVQDSKVETIREQIGAIQNTVEILEKDITAIEDKNTSLDQIIQSVCANLQV